ncbi:MAG: adenine-specific methyltransferase EcoRI family protein [Pseudomonadales bacterium]|jgi:hypothetical protein|nr:adenine-specific methyltransferase EcoRI family protein [Pseudomonadales bacterium]
MANKSLHSAKQSKNDEFYTQLVDIEKELKHYKEQLANKVIFCNCDDPFESNFFKYFASNFNHLKLKKLIATCYCPSPIAGGQIALFDVSPPLKKGMNKNTKQAYKIEINEVKDETGDGSVGLADVEHLLRNKNNILTLLEGDGDFRSEECVELLKQADIIVTNPPFSLFREYVAQLMEYEKKFLIVGTDDAITYKNIFPFIRDQKLWRGYGRVQSFIKPSGEIQKFGKIGWYTNLDVSKRHEEITLYKKYSEEEYPKYDNYDAIEVRNVAEIPLDYDGIMGVPISFLNKYNPNQFEIVGSNRGIDQDSNGVYGRGSYLNDKETFKRLFIKRKDKNA